MKFSKRIIVSFSAFLLVIVSFFIIKSSNKKSVFASSGKMVDGYTIIIDAGHGGFDGGAQAGDGTNEKNINLAIAKDLEQLLKFSGFNVIMTRNDDTGTEDDPNADIRDRKVSDMQNRLKLMQNNPDAIFVSVHLNKFTSVKVSGAQVFYSKNNTDSLPLAINIQESLKNKLQPDNERVVKQGTKATYLLHKTTIPAVIVECGFLSNTSELEKLKTEKYQRQTAFSIYCGICDYYLKK